MKNYLHLVGNQYAKGHKKNKTCFKKGHIPWNKDIKGIHLSPESEFKVGRKSEKTMPLQSITQRTTKGGKIRNFIKIGEPNKWIEYAKCLWIKNYGILYKGDITHHLNGIAIDDRIENIIAMPRVDHPIFHNRWGLKQLSNKQIEFYIKRYVEITEKRLSQTTEMMF